MQHDGREVEETFYAINIAPEAGCVKTGGFRSVPMHDHLVEQGFIDFVLQRDKGPNRGDLPGHQPYVHPGDGAGFAGCAREDIKATAAVVAGAVTPPAQPSMLRVHRAAPLERPNSSCRRRRFQARSSLPSRWPGGSARTDCPHTVEESGICAEGRRGIRAPVFKPALAIGTVRARQASPTRRRETTITGLPDRGAGIRPDALHHPAEQTGLPLDPPGHGPHPRTRR